jgi:hypothetical protein
MRFGERTDRNDAALVDPERLGIMPRVMAVLENSLRRDTYVNTATVIVACEVIAADSRFNIWFYDVVKQQATEEQCIEILERGDDLRKMCLLTVTKFHEDHDNLVLQLALEKVAAELGEIMKSYFSEAGQ